MQSPSYSRALGYLRTMLGSEASFREGQFEAIEALLGETRRLMMVQRTGWGKSVVYFIATRLLRDAGKGPALLVSPLLALMRNQILMAERIGVRAATINSSNASEWKEIEARLLADKVDVLLISPERLNSDRFVETVLPAMQRRIGLFIVDEVHCISDWGHDFRPDYQRIVRVLQQVPRNVPFIGVTATANDRVVQDVQQQLGSELQIIRGPLMRESLHLRNIRLNSQAERLAWLAENLDHFPGSGIIYTLTVADSRRVAAWLQKKGIDVRAYNADLSSEERIACEEALLKNEVKALSATVALGMGFDKPDLHFVIHFQRPGSVVAYYQQIGRAGRAVHQAAGVLLSGIEDDEIQEYFIDTAFPPPEIMQSILKNLAESSGRTLGELQACINTSFSTLEKALKLLAIEGAIIKDKAVYHRTTNPWKPDYARYEAVTLARKHELAKMQEYVRTKECLMVFLARELSDPHAQSCGRCSNCSAPALPGEVQNENITQEAIRFLRGDFQLILPRKQWPSGGAHPGDKRAISKEALNQEGRSLCIYGDAGWGRAVATGKYNDHHFSDQLVQAAAHMIRREWKPDPFPRFVTFVPSLREAALVRNFAERLAHSLELPLAPVLEKTRETRPQKLMENSAQQAANILSAFQIKQNCHVPEGPCLLVDDIVDSRWTLTVTGYLISTRGGGPVYPFTLAKAADRNTMEQGT